MNIAVKPAQSNVARMDVVAAVLPGEDAQPADSFDELLAEGLVVETAAEACDAPGQETELLSATAHDPLALLLEEAIPPSVESESSKLGESADDAEDASLDSLVGLLLPITPTPAETDAEISDSTNADELSTEIAEGERPVTDMSMESDPEAIPAHEADGRVAVDGAESADMPTAEDIDMSVRSGKTDVDEIETTEGSDFPEPSAMESDPAESAESAPN